MGKQRESLQVKEGAEFSLFVSYQVPPLCSGGDGEEEGEGKRRWEKVEWCDVSD